METGAGSCESHLSGSDRGHALLLVKDAEWRGVASPGPSLESPLLNISAASTVWVSQAWRLPCRDR